LKRLNFSVDASIIERLGMELVSKKETALSELVKNAYDADATEVKLIFRDTEKEGGTLIIDDDGLGMTEGQLVNGFLRIASAEKLENPYSKEFKRRRAGRKGIGRFAVHRLGEKLTVITQTKGSEKALKLEIDWNNFSVGKDLSEIGISIFEIDKEKEEGTKLIIDKLRDKWNDEDIKRAYRYLRDILQPFPLSKKAESTNLDPGFRVACYRNKVLDENLIIDETKSFFEHALAEIDALIDDSGVVYYSISSKKLNYKEGQIPLNKSNPYKVLRNVSLKAYYFIYESKLLPKGMLSFIKSVAKREGGIRIYKNGFRVMPYGEPDIDDWLGLDESTAKRGVLPSHGNINFFGFIEIRDENEEFFKEKSDREGFIENEAFRELRDFGYKVLKDAVIKVAEKRGKKPKAGTKSWKTKLEEVEEKVGYLYNKIENLEELATKLEDLETKDTVLEVVEELKDNILQIRNISNTAKRKFEEVEKEYLDEIGFLRILASMGLTIGEFVHEVKHMIDSLTSLNRKLLSYPQRNNKINEIAKKLEDNIGILKAYIGYFDKTISQSISKELCNQDLRGVVNEFIEMIKISNRYKNLEIEKEFDGIAIMTIPMHRAELMSVLMNLFTNSVKAIKRAGRRLGKIKIKAGKESKVVYIEFSDNGDGIPPDKRERIFNPFFTTSEPHGRYVEDYKELTGMGLGLKIIKDIVEGYNGKIYVKELSEEGYSTTFRIELPKGELAYGKRKG